MIGTTVRTLTSGGVDRTYVLHVPAGHPEPKALVIELHGGGGRGDEIDRLTGFNALADAQGFVVAAPSVLAGNWNDGRPEVATGGFAGGGGQIGQQGVDDVRFISDVIDDVRSVASIDDLRIYAAGISNGAMMSTRLACELSDRIAAVGLVAGTGAVSLVRGCRPTRPVSVIAFNGTADPLVPYEGGQVTAFGSDRGEVVSVDALAARMASLGGCTDPPAASSAGPSVTLRRWSCPNGVGVDFYRVEGGGHTWPGGVQYLPVRLIGPTTADVDATHLIWQFFEDHPRLS